MQAASTAAYLHVKPVTAQRYRPFGEAVRSREKEGIEHYFEHIYIHLNNSIPVCAFHRSRSTDPVCLGLQAQILSCYRDNRDQTLRCSDLAKEYMRCIDAAKKVSASCPAHILITRVAKATSKASFR